MKKKIIVIENSIVISILLIAIIFFIWSLMYKKKIKEQNEVVKTENVQEIVTNKISKQLFHKRILPTDIDGFEIIGKLEIPKINLSTYVLSKTSDEALNKSVTKLCGPNINEARKFLHIRS